MNGHGPSLPPSAGISSKGHTNGSPQDGHRSTAERSGFESQPPSSPGRCRVSSASDSSSVQREGRLNLLAVLGIKRHRVLDVCISQASPGGHGIHGEERRGKGGFEERDGAGQKTRKNHLQEDVCW